MPDPAAAPPKPTSKTASAAAALRELRRRRRELDGKVAAEAFSALASGLSQADVARQFKISPSRVKRLVDREVKARGVTTSEHFLHLQVARLQKALMALDGALDEGRVEAVAPLLRIVERLDHYHGLTAPPPSARPIVAHPALTHQPTQALAVASICEGQEFEITGRASKLD